MKLYHRVIIAACLLLAGFDMHAVAQTFSFPVCQGDASSWHIQQRDPNRSDYTPPVIRTVNVDRDTVAFGETYFYLAYPELMRLPAIWARSDSLGLFCLTATGDSLLLPSIDSIGTPVMGGEISDTLTVHTMFGQARAYKVRRIDGDRTLVWTVADGIGIWDFFSWRKGSGEYYYCRFLSGRRCGQGPPGDPVAIDVPLHARDILVRTRGDGGSTIESAKQSSRGPSWVGLPASSALLFDNRSFSVTINPDCIVYYDPSDFMGSAPASEYYPAYIPATDSITLDGRRWSVERRFDTTVFAQPVRAFAIRGQTSRGEFVRIVTEKFGVVREIALSGSPASFSSVLASAVVNGVAYNRGTERHRFFPLCRENVYEYRMTSRSYDTIARVRLTEDTLVDGVEYFRFRLPGIPYHPNTTVEKSLINGWFREAEDGIYSIDSTLAYPFAADLGDITHSGIVIGIRQRSFGGDSRFVLVTANFGYHYDRQDTLVEGIGPIAAKDYLLFEGGFRWELTGAVICGEPWGIPLGVSETPVPQEEPDMLLYPNPVPAAGGLVHVRLAGGMPGAVRLSLHDLLGRELRSQEVTHDRGDTEYAIPLGNLPAGMYVLRLQTGHRTVSRNLLLLKCGE